jgi:RNA polymerase sigma factor (sigma-70 family)
MKNTCFYSAVARAEQSLRLRYYYVSSDDRADALQTAILRFLEKTYCFDSAELEHNLPSFLTDEDECTRWLSRVAEHSIIDHWRKKQNINSLPSVFSLDQEQKNELIEQLCSSLPPFEISLDYSEALQTIELPIRECFELHVEGWTFYEIASHLGISEACAQKRYQRAKQRIRKILASYSITKRK